VVLKILKKESVKNVIDRLLHTKIVNLQRVNGIGIVDNFFMGDRGNIKVIQEENSTPIYLYTHWNGSSILETVQKALQKHWRWNDSPYLTRIIFDVLTETKHGNEIGFGISTFICDNEHLIVVVDVPKQKVYEEVPENSSSRYLTKCKKRSFSFEELCNTTLKEE
jgi:hypothetical protein